MPFGCLPSGIDIEVYEKDLCGSRNADDCHDRGILGIGI